MRVASVQKDQKKKQAALIIYIRYNEFLGM
jgi:hypothetical protein